MSLRIDNKKIQEYPEEKSPLGAQLPTLPADTNLKTRLKTYFIHFVGSRYLAKRLLTIYAFTQLAFLSAAIRFAYNSHMQAISESSKGESFLKYMQIALPGSIILPVLVGFTLWPSFLLFGLLRSRNSREVDTIVPHVEFIKKKQLQLVNQFYESAFDERMEALKTSLGRKVSNDIKLLIVETCRNDLDYEKNKIIGPLMWSPKYKLHPLTTWARVISLWSLFTGIGNEYRIPTEVQLKYGGLTVALFARDASLVCLGCIVRYNLILWITKTQS